MTRHAAYPILDIILNRWSSRAMNGEPLKKNDLMPLFEAARWAPSSYNNQPWRFIYGLKNTVHWQPLFDLLVPFNQSWCANAGALILVCSDTLFAFNKKFSRSHSFDTGAAWQNFALQGFANGLVIHALEGFDYEKARIVYQLPETITIQAMIAVGYPAKKETLPEELQKKETASNRNPLESFVFEGKFS